MTDRHVSASERATESFNVTSTGQLSHQGAGVPQEDQQEFAKSLQGRPRADGGIGNTGEETMSHNPL
ncbi:hypothetical protein GCM10018954_091670 [Kutzneria kofuensis]